MQGEGFGLSPLLWELWNRVKNYIDERYSYAVLDEPQFSSQKIRTLELANSELKTVEETEQTLDNALRTFKKSLESFEERKNALLSQRQKLSDQLYEIKHPNISTEQTSMDPEARKAEKGLELLLSSSLELDIPRLMKQVNNKIEYYKDEILSLEEKKKEIAQQKAELLQLISNSMKRTPQLQTKEEEGGVLSFPLQDISSLPSTSSSSQLSSETPKITTPEPNISGENESEEDSGAGVFPHKFNTLSVSPEIPTSNGSLEFTHHAGTEIYSVESLVPESSMEIQPMHLPTNTTPTIDLS